MKKLSFLSTITLITIALFFVKTESKAQSIDNWFKTGSKAKSYEIGFDNSVVKTGKKSAYIESIDRKIKGFGTLMQSCDAKIYLGKRIKMTAYIKTENVKGWSGMWLRVDAKDPNAPKRVLSFDNMHDRAIRGTNDWTKCEIALDVPFESGSLNFGVLLNSTGKVWFDKISFEVVDNISTKPTKKELPEKPVNIDFEE